jgi:hypothetical protein
MRRSRLSFIVSLATLALPASSLTFSAMSAHAAAADCTAGEVCVNWHSPNAAP